MVSTKRPYVSSASRLARNSITAAFEPINANFPANTHDSSPPPLVTVDHKSSGPPMAAHNLCFALIVDGTDCVIQCANVEFFSVQPLRLCGLLVVHLNSPQRRRERKGCAEKNSDSYPLSGCHWSRNRQWTAVHVFWNRHVRCLEHCGSDVVDRSRRQ